MIKKTILLLLVILGISQGVKAQYYGVRLNTLALTTGTLNAGFEVMLGDKYTADISAYWNPVKAKNLQMQFVAVQPGIRRWFYESYTGHFVAAHLAYAHYSVGGSDHYSKGWLTGIGVSYGYAWPLSKRWNLSVEAGLGIYYMRDTKRAHYVGEFDDEYIRRYRRWNLLPSKCEVSFTYLF